MKTKTSGRLFFVLLVLSILSLGINIRIGKANPAIVINPDGSIDPPTAPIQCDGNVYTFTADIYDTIVVHRENIVIDGNNFKLQGLGGGIGFEFEPTFSWNVTIRNTIISGFSYGIRMATWGNSIESNAITDNTYGISLYNANAKISDNVITRNSGGILLTDSGAVISDNTIINNTMGIQSDRSGGSWVNNIITNNSAGITATYLSNSNIMGNNISYNTAEGIWLYSSSGNDISRNFLEHNNKGVLIPSYPVDIVENNKITNNTFLDNTVGLETIGTDELVFNNSIYHNNFINNFLHFNGTPGINYWDDGYPSGGNFWSDYAGIDLYNGPYQNLTGSDGIGDTPYAVALENVDKYPLMTPYNTTEFFVLRITTTTGGTTNPTPGPYVYTSGTVVGVTAVSEADYIFDYWELDNVNVGATNPISVSMDTNHALHAVFKPKPDIAVTSVVPYPTNVRRGQLVYIDVTVANKRFTSETFDVVVYADRDRNIIGDEIIAGVQTVYNLLPGGTKTITFIWDTSTLPSGTGYYISAEAIVPSDIDPSNNLLTAKKKVTIRR